MAWQESAPYRDWARFAWRDTTLPEALEDALRRVPGVDVRCVDAARGLIDVPANAECLAVVKALREHTGYVSRSVSLSGMAAASHRQAVLAALADKLRPYQVSAVERLVAEGSGFLCDEMGLGKTRTAAATAEIWRRTMPDRPVLIVGPAYAREVWRRELTLLGLVEQPEHFVGLAGRTARQDPPREARFWYCHYEILEAWRARITLPSRGARYAPGVLVVDEAHNVRNVSAQRTKAIRQIAATCAHRLVLTGTPMMNKPRELWPLLTLVDGVKSWGDTLAFRRRYCGAFMGDYGWQDGEPTNTDELRARLARRFIRRTKTDVALDLPPLMRQAVMVSDDAHGPTVCDLGVTEREAILRALVTGRGGDETLRLIHRLRVASSKAKRPATLGLVADVLAEPDEAVVVFVIERATADMLAFAINKAAGEPVALAVHGAHPLEERDRMIATFQANEGGPRVLVATYGALREGVTLTRARNLILHDLEWVPSTVLQAEARVHRLGQHAAVMVRWMILRGSIDELFLQALHEKTGRIEQTLEIGDGRRALDQLGPDAWSAAQDYFDDDVRDILSWLE